MTKEQCVKLADKVEEYIELLHGQFIESIGPHDIVLADRSFIKVPNMDLLEWQQSMETNITSNNAKAEKLKDDFSAQEQAYYNILKMEMGQAEDIPAVSVSVEYIFIGMVLFVIGYMLYLFLKYILSNKIHMGDDISKIYGLPELGNIPRATAHKKLLGVADNRIIKLRNRNKRIFTAEEAIGMTAVTVKMAARKAGAKEVFCIGCDMQERAYKTAVKIQNILKSENISMNILNNVLYDQEALEQLSAAKCAFLLETVNNTFYEEIAKEVKLLERQEITVLGGVIVE